MENGIVTVYVYFATSGQRVGKEMPNDCEVLDSTPSSQGVVLK